MRTSVALLTLALLPSSLLAADLAGTWKAQPNIQRSEATATRRTAVTLAQVAAAEPVATNAQSAGNPGGGRGGRGRFGGPIELGPDDKPAFPEAPAGFNVRRDNIPHGEVKAVQYDSKTLGTRRQLRVYTPPGYSTERKYPVLFLLHGLGMDDRQWLGGCHADIVIDNLLADGKVQPMIMVFPNGDANLTAADAEAGRSSSRNGVGGRFDNWGTPFENDLLKDIIPFIESHYSVYTDSHHRALAGLSMGGGQALNIGLVHPETFSCVGGFSSAPNTRGFGGISPSSKLLPDPETARRLKLLWLACGSRDGLIRVSQGVHRMLKENSVPHFWHVDSHAHDDPEWSGNLYLFAQHLFKTESGAKGEAGTAPSSSEEQRDARMNTNFWIFLCFGQSNMESGGRMQEMDRTVDERFLVMADFDAPNRGWTRGKWYHAVPPLTAQGTGICLVDYFGRTMISNLPPNIRVGVIKVSVPGCKIELFQKDTFTNYVATAPSWMLNFVKKYGGNPYQYLVDLAKLAQKDGVIKGILLHQGESNPNDREWPNKVKGIYDDLIKELNLKPEEVPFLAGETVNADQGGACAGFNLIMAELPKALPNSYVVSSAGCTCNPDHLHFNSAGSRELGKRYGEKLLAVMGYKIKEPSPPAPAVTQTDSTGAAAVPAPAIGLKDAFAGKFLIGCAGDLPRGYSEAELANIKANYNIVTPENCMKPQPIHPSETNFNFSTPDALAQWGAENNIKVWGHTLAWHAQTARWFFQGTNGEPVTRELAMERLSNHIRAVVGRYRGKVLGWDVVNEAINDGGDGQTENLRNSPWLKAIGPDFLTWAFKWAHEADPEAQLYYNDYNIEQGAVQNQGKHASSMLLLKRLIKEGAPITGVGIQGHWHLNTKISDVEKAIENYESLGLKVSISELDVTSTGENSGAFPTGGNAGTVSAEAFQKQAEVYGKLFDVFNRHAKTISRVTFWGISDRRSWRSRQRPLLYDGQLQPKPALQAILDVAKGKE